MIATQIINRNYGKAVYPLSIATVMSQCKLQKLSYINSFCLWWCGLAGLSWTWLDDWASGNGSGWALVKFGLQWLRVFCVIWRSSYEDVRIARDIAQWHKVLLPDNIPLAQQVTWSNPKSRCGESIFHPLTERDFKVTWGQI